VLATALLAECFETHCLQAEPPTAVLFAQVCWHVTAQRARAVVRSPLHWRGVCAESGEVLTSCVAPCAPLAHLLLWLPPTADYCQWAACAVLQHRPWCNPGVTPARRQHQATRPLDVAELSPSCAMDDPTSAAVSSELQASCLALAPLRSAYKAHGPTVWARVCLTVTKHHLCEPFCQGYRSLFPRVAVHEPTHTTLVVQGQAAHCR